MSLRIIILPFVWEGLIAFFLLKIGIIILSSPAFQVDHFVMSFVGDCGSKPIKSTVTPMNKELVKIF